MTANFLVVIAVIFGGLAMLTDDARKSRGVAALAALVFVCWTALNIAAVLS